MKGLIFVRDPIGTVFEGEIEVDDNTGTFSPMKEFSLKRKGRGRQLKLRARSPEQNRLTCVVGSGKSYRIFFDFQGNKSLTTVTGKDAGTGKFVPWTCIFTKHKE